MRIFPRNVRCLACSVLAPFLLCLGLVAQAQDFPSRPMRIIVPYPPGGIPDPVTRVVAQSMSETLGQPIVVENKLGGGGLPAVRDLQQSKPDGYTLLCLDNGMWALQPALRPGIYDPLKDFAPVGTAVMTTIYVTVNDSLRVKTIQELVALAKANPGKFSFGTSGVGTSHQLLMETVKAHFGIDLVHVPYKGAASSAAALVAGEIPVVIASMGTLAPHMKTGKIRRLLASTFRRSAFSPEVPGLGDVGIDNNFAGDVGYVAPGGTPRTVIDKLAGALAKAVQTPEFAKRMEGLFVEVSYRTPEQFEEAIRQDVPRYARAVKLSGAKAE